MDPRYGKKSLSPFFLIQSFPNPFVVREWRQKDDGSWHNKTSLHLSSDVSVLEKTIQSLPQEHSPLGYCHQRGLQSTWITQNVYMVNRTFRLVTYSKKNGQDTVSNWQERGWSRHHPRCWRPGLVKGRRTSSFSSYFCHDSSISGYSCG
jgi:hypothetical protein